jgi:anti-anti-sigma factor
MSTNSRSIDEPAIELRWPQPGTALIVMSGEHDLASAPALQQTIDVAFSECSHLIIDISDTTFIDSSTIATLIRARERADGETREFNVVLGTAAIVERALEVSEVIPLLNVVPTVDEALNN